MGGSAETLEISVWFLSVVVLVEFICGDQYGFRSDSRMFSCWYAYGYGLYALESGHTLV
jgi:hypothetical protein